MKNILFAVLLLLLPIGIASATNAGEIESLLKQLDHEIEHREDYFAIRQHRIDSAKIEYRVRPTLSETAYAVGALYASFQCDSAIVWLQRAQELAGGELPEEQQIVLDRCLGRSTGVDIPFNYSDELGEENTQQFAINAVYKAVALFMKGDSLTAVSLLARSAIVDVQQAVTDNGAIWKLAQAVYNDGQVERAYNYIVYSCANADYYNSKLRYTQINPLAADIAKTYQGKLVKMAKSLTLASISAVLMVIVLIIVIVYTYRQNKKLHRLNRSMKNANIEQEKVNKKLNEAISNLESANEQLNEMNQIREHYICVYLEEKSGDIRRLYKESLKAGSKDAEEKFKQRLESYYHSFDTTFLRLYPNFVDQINSLLRLDSQVTPPKGCLTHELRIFALIRLGITRSTRISELLCLSPNTVYNYRSRMKNLCVGNRDEFEQTVRNL